MKKNIFELLAYTIKTNKILEKSARNIYVTFIPILIRDELSRRKVNPYSNLEVENEIIFIHVPKNAGNGVIKSLLGSNPKGHNFITDYKKYNSEYYDKFYKFGFVRNPWDRVVSSYFYLQKGGFGVYDKEFYSKYLYDINSFEEFVKKIGSDRKFKENILRWTHFLPQKKFICDESGRIALNDLFRYETIEKDFSHLKKKLQKPSAELQNHNKSNHKEYWEYYDEEMIEIIREIYNEDIELLGYEFPYEKMRIVSE